MYCDMYTFGGFIGLSVFGSRDQAKDHGLRTGGCTHFHLSFSIKPGQSRVVRRDLGLQGDSTASLGFIGSLSSQDPLRALSEKAWRKRGLQCTSATRRNLSIAGGRACSDVFNSQGSERGARRFRNDGAADGHGHQLAVILWARNAIGVAHECQRTRSRCARWRQKIVCLLRARARRKRGWAGRRGGAERRGGGAGCMGARAGRMDGVGRQAGTGRRAQVGVACAYFSEAESLI